MFSSHESIRKNQIWQWAPTDTFDNYRKYLPDGSPNYGIDDFDYKFNSGGFRCDECGAVVGSMGMPGECKELYDMEKVIDKLKGKK